MTNCMAVFLCLMAASLEERLRTAEETLELERQQHRKSQEAQLAAGAGDEVSGGKVSVGSHVNYDELSIIMYIAVMKWFFKKALDSTTVTHTLLSDCVHQVSLGSPSLLLSTLVKGIKCLCVCVCVPVCVCISLFLRTPLAHPISFTPHGSSNAIL